MNVCVCTIDHPTMFMVVPLKANYNALLGRNWMHEVEEILSTLHQKLILWNKEGKTKEIITDNVTSPISIVLNYFPFCLKLELVSIMLEVGPRVYSI